MAKASGGTRTKGASSSAERIIDRTSYKKTDDDIWTLDGGNLGVVTIQRGSNLYASYDGVKNIYEVAAVSNDGRRHAEQKFFDGFVQAKRWGKEKLKEFNK